MKESKVREIVKDEITTKFLVEIIKKAHKEAKAEEDAMAITGTPKEGEYWWGQSNIARYSGDGFYWIKNSDGPKSSLGNGYFKRKATSEEIEPELITEAKGKGYKPGVKWGNKANPLSGCSAYSGFSYDSFNDVLYFMGTSIYGKGNWHEIIKEEPLTKEDIDAGVIWDLANQEKLYKFGQLEISKSPISHTSLCCLHFVAIKDGRVVSDDIDLSLNDLKILGQLRDCGTIKLNEFDVLSGFRYNKPIFDVGCVKNITLEQIQTIIKQLEK